MTRIEKFYSRVTSFSFLLGLFVLCITIIIVLDVYLRKIPELFLGASLIGDIVFNLSLAYLSSFVFYFLVVHLKDKRNKYILDPYIALKTRSVVHSGKILIRFLVEESKTKIQGEYPTLEETQLMCSKLNPNSYVTGWLNTNWLQLFRHYYIQSERAIIAIYEKIPFIDAKLIRILGDIQSTPHYNVLRTGPKLDHIGSTDLTQFSKHLFIYLELIHDLEGYAEKEVSNFERIKIEIN